MNRDDGQGRADDDHNRIGQEHLRQATDQEGRHLTADRASRSDAQAPRPDDQSSACAPSNKERPKEIGGPKGPEPTRYGDWERNGRCSDF